MVSTHTTPDRAHPGAHSARQAHRFIRTGAAGQMVNFPALDRVIGEITDLEIAGTYREIAADLRDRAEHIIAEAGPGSCDAAVFAELADEFDERGQRWAERAEQSRRHHGGIA